MKNSGKFLPIISSAFLIQAGYGQIWTGGAGDDIFGNGLNWSNGAPPTGGALGVFRDSSAPPMVPINVVVDSSTAIAGLRTIRSTGPVSVSVDAGEVLTVRTGGGVDFLADGSGDLTLSGTIYARDNDTSGALNVAATSGSAISLDGATINGDVDASVVFDGTGELSVIDSDFNIPANVATGALKVVDSSFNDDLFVDSGASVQLGDASSNGGVTVTGTTDLDGQWVFDVQTLANGSAPSFDALDIDSGATLLVTGSTAGASTTNPLIIGSYSSLSGSFTAGNISGLGPGQSIDLNFGGGNVIAIVPEVSNVLPVLLGFLPIMFFKRRSKK